MIREAVTNSVRHAAATTVTIRLATAGDELRHGDVVTVAVRGIGVLTNPVA